MTSVTRTTFTSNMSAQATLSATRTPTGWCAKSPLAYARGPLVGNAQVSGSAHPKAVVAASWARSRLAASPMVNAKSS